MERNSFAHHISLSDVSVLLEEPFESLQPETIVDIGVRFQGWRQDCTVPPACRGGILLVAHVVVRETRKLASLPTEVALIPTVVEAAGKEKPVHNHGELVDVPHLYGVLCFNHLQIIFTIK